MSGRAEVDLMQDIFDVVAAETRPWRPIRRLLHGIGRVLISGQKTHVVGGRDTCDIVPTAKCEMVRKSLRSGHQFGILIRFVAARTGKW